MMIMIDRFNRKIEYLRISVTDRCNLRCQYCMPESGVTKLEHKDILTFEEILRVVKVLAKLGIRKVRLTGGEPLLRRNIVSLVENIKSIDGIEQIFLTTNGVLLSRLADELIAAGLDGINLSLDALDGNIFAKVTRRKFLDDVLSGLRKIVDGGIEIKINCVPIVGINECETLKIAELAQNFPVKVRFIELMPISCATGFEGVSTSKLKTQIENRYGELTPLPKKYLQGPAQYFTLPNFKGQIGFIDAIEHKFCKSCNRIRLTSDGFLKLCLNSNAGLNVKNLLRSNVSEENLIDELQQAIYNKPQEHNFGKTFDSTKMYQVGG